MKIEEGQNEHEEVVLFEEEEQGLSSELPPNWGNLVCEAWWKWVIFRCQCFRDSVI